MTDDARDVQAALAARYDPADAPAGHQAFGRLYDRHAPVVRALCAARLPSPTDADDAAQETFLRAYRLLHEVRDPDGLRAWLYAIARNVCAERRRAAARRTNHEHAAAQERLAMTGALSTTPARLDGARAATDGAEHAERLARLSDALDRLPDDQRLAIHLYYLEADPIAAAHSVLGLSRSGFYKLLARAREGLASMLGAVAP